MLSDGKDEDELLRFNDLDYTIDPVTSVCVSREFATYKSTETSYYVSCPQVGTPQRDDNYIEPKTNTKKIEVKLTSGSRFIDPKNSYVKFKYTINPPTGPEAVVEPDPYPEITFDLSSPSEFTYLPGLGLASPTNRLLTNLFDRVEWEHSCKRMITDMPHVNHHVLQEVHTRNDDWQRSIASLFTLQSPQIILADPTDIQEKYIGVAIIPLEVLLPSWKCQPGRLLSNRMVGGSTLRFTLAKLSKAFYMIYRIQPNAGEEIPVLTTPPEVDLGIDFSTCDVTFEQFEVVLDQREMISSVDNLLWNQSVVYGSPSSYSHYETVMQHEPVTWIANAPVEGEDYTGAIDTYVGKRKLTLSKHNLSRLDSCLTSIVLRPIGTYYDFFLDFFKHPRFDEYQALALTGANIQNDRYHIGYEYWPQKDLAEEQDDSDPMLVQSFLFSILYPDSGLRVEEFEVYFGGAGVLTTRRDEALSTSGKSFTQKRPLEATLDYSVELHYSDLADKLGIYIRTWKRYQRILNVYGNVLEWRE